MMTDDERVLVDEYLPRIDAELLRIGFTADDFRYLGGGGSVTREAFEADLERLRSIPSGIGANAYFARYGVDFAAIKRMSAP